MLSGNKMGELVFEVLAEVELLLDDDSSEAREEEEWEKGWEDVSAREEEGGKELE